MLPSVRMLYPNGITQFQQDCHSNHDSCVIQEWLSLQTNAKLIDWSPRVPNINPIENMWSEVKRTMQETWPVPLPERAMSYGPLCQTRGMKLLHLRHTFDH